MRVAQSKYAAVTGLFRWDQYAKMLGQCKSMHIYGVISCTTFCTPVMTLTFKGGRLWVAVAEASGEMYKDPLSLLGLSH